MLKYNKQISIILLLKSLMITSLTIRINDNDVVSREDTRTLNHLVEMIQNYWQKNVSLPICTSSQANLCCMDTVSDICDVCEEACPCLCTVKRSGFDTDSSQAPSNIPSQPQTPAATSSDVSFSAYTLILSIGLPTVSIILIICTLLSITYCCKPKPSSSSITNQSDNNLDPAVSVSNLSLVYINMDDQNLGDSTTNLSRSGTNKNLKESPPKYSDYIKSGFVDKLPSYKSFRGKNKMNQSDENVADKH